MGHQLIASTLTAPFDQIRRGTGLDFRFCFLECGLISGPADYLQWSHGLRVFFEYRTRNIDFRISNELSDPSTFDIPCSIFDIKKTSSIKVTTAILAAEAMDLSTTCRIVILL